MNKLSDIGLIGLAVMDENIVLNMESKGLHTMHNKCNCWSIRNEKN